MLPAEALLCPRAALLWPQVASPCPSSKTFFKFARSTREALKKAKDVGEPEADELVLLLINGATDVIAPDGRIIYTYTDMNPEKHVANTLAALRQWAAEKKQ